MRSKSVPVNLLIRKIHTALGDGGEEGSPEESEEKIDTEEDNRSITPNSNSPSPVEEGQSPSPGDIPSPSSPTSINEESNLRRRSTSRCNSRESSDSQLPFSSCPPADSERMFAERAALLHGVPVSTELSPVGVSLPPSIPAALLPSQSAAMAAYLNAAAAAAVQSHRLMMTSPLPRTFPRPPVSPLIGATSSPPGLLMPHVGELSPNSEGILDYSRKASSKIISDESGGGDVVNLSKTTSVSHGESGTAPLDLSFSNRKRTSDEPLTQTPSRKAKMDYKPSIPPWPPSIGAQHLPYFAAAVAAAGLSPKNHPSDLWNGKVKPIPPAPSDATKALEKMSELSKIGGSSEELFRSMPGNSTSNRHSAWQSHWLNKGAEQAKDVLKCVWCKQSFPSLAALTTHMKEAKHCGVNVPVPPMQPTQPQISSSPSSTNTISTSSNSTKPTQSDLNMLIKETMPLPRKLVRGQDVWLGKGAEQTRQILKCMWCGQSFRSLAEMTSHMQQTQHYTNIISQEQIISWRSTDDGKSTVGSSSGNQTPTGGTSSHVSAVLTCKVCDQAFSSLKELSNHMVKNSHYKEHIMRSITESGGRRRQTREKRKKSLPVRKLLELERAQNGDGSSILDKLRDPSGAAGRITCEKCNNKIETSMFVDHIRQCVGGLSSNQRNFLKTALMPNNVILPPESPERNKMKTPSDKSPSPTPSVSDKSTKESTGSGETNNGSSPSVLNAIEKLIEKSFDSRSRQNPSFPGHGHNQAPIGSSILKRLGIDESVDYTKPLVDPQTMNLLRSYHQQHYNNRRERSGSESSSMSERGFGRVDSLTPEGKMEPPLSGIPLSATPEIKREKSPIENETPEITVKKEVEENDTIENLPPPSSSTEGVNLKIKKEKDDDMMVDHHHHHHHHHDSHNNYANGEITKDDEEKRRVSPTSQASISGEPSSAHHHHSPASSPASSDRSGTPRSTTSDKKSEGGSLGALSSMFDSLSGANNLSETSSNKKASNHPLAALQKLCDKTDNHTNNRAHSSSSSSAQSASTSSSTTTNIPCSTPNPITTTPGAILAFSWACNDAVVTPDAIMKCAFCDTPFISKGAYRHHLSKMHFVKDGVIPDPVALKSTASTSGSSVGVSLKGSSVLPSGSSSATSPKSPPSAPSGFEESPHSKFLKYTELAKQLSSKYV